MCVGGKDRFGLGTWLVQSDPETPPSIWYLRVFCSAAVNGCRTAPAVCTRLYVYTWYHTRYLVASWPIYARHVEPLTTSEEEVGFGYLDEWGERGWVLEFLVGQMGGWIGLLLSLIHI